MVAVTRGRLASWWILAGGAVFAAQAGPAGAALLFSDGFEGVSLPAATDTHTPPAPWSFVSTATGNPVDTGVSVSWSGIFNPTGTGRFGSTGPLAGPAGGNNYLYVTGSENRAVRSAGTLQAGVTYTLSAAVGYDTAISALGNQQWVMELWAGAVGPTGMLLASQDGTAISIPYGRWLLQSLSYTATAATAGQTLTVALGSRYAGAPFYYPGNFDAVSLATVPALPEPVAGGLFGLGVLALVGLGRRRTAP